MYIQTKARQEHFALIQKKCLARHQEIKADRIKVYNENPKIIWSDHDDLPRLYYPDFYLPDHNLYLDPKNPHCMKLDVEKMRSVSDLIDIRYGSLPYILSEIDVLVGVQSTAL